MQVLNKNYPKHEGLNMQIKNVKKYEQKKNYLEICEKKKLNL